MPRWMSILLSALVVFVVSAAVVRIWRVIAVQRQERITLEQWVYASDLGWRSATTGWLAIANDGLPAKDTAFTDRPIMLAGAQYSKGLGTYPVSEIEYGVEPDLERFESIVGLDDAVPVGSGGAEFFVFLDDVLAFRSGIMRGGDIPKHIDVPVAGAGRLKLVVSDESDGAIVNYADWADARFVRRLAGENVGEAASIVGKSDPERARAREAARAEADRLGVWAAGDLRYWETSATKSPGEISTDFSPTRGDLFLSNGKIAVAIGYGGPAHGTITIYDVPSQRHVAYRVSPSAQLAQGLEVQLARDTTAIEKGYSFSPVSDEVLGDGQNLSARFLGPPGEITLSVSLFKGHRYVVMQMSADKDVDVGKPVRFRLLDVGQGGLLLGDGAEYFTDYTRLRHGLAPDDGITRKEAVGPGNPVFVRSDSYPQALILSALDETTAPSSFWIVRNPETAVTGARFEAPEVTGKEPAAHVSPRVYLEITESNDPRLAFEQYKSVMAKIAPAIPLPSWVKYQWLSWYVYYMEINEDAIRRQIDYIAENLSDLGTWSILVDAGWYISEGRARSDWRHVDRAKFPSGLRNLVDYAHSRGQKVVLYFSTPYYDTRVRSGDWLGLSTLIKEHPDWFKLLGQRRERKSYAIDYDNPEAREYLRSVLRDYFEKYDVDGIKVDGLGNADGALLNQDRPDQFGLVGGLVGQTLEIYRFIYENARSIKDDAYIESGWMTPVLANPYAHTFRFGDEYPSFSNNYPTPGMVQHLDYAVWQKMALGQQSNMGAVFGDPNASLVNLWWLQAGVALGTQTVLSFDLPAMTLETLSQFRSILAHYDAFEGRTVYERSLQPSYFATTVGSTTYLGVLNRGVEPKPFYVALQDLGLDVSNKRVVVYDVTGKRFSRPRDRIRAELYPEGFRFYVIRGAPGVVWTNSSLHDEKATDSSFQVEVRGPRALDGFAYIYAPQPREVSIDGRALTPSLISLADSDHYAYDARNRIVTLSYDHDAPHVIKVEYK